MQTKIYKLIKRGSAYFETKYCGVVVAMPFTMSMGCDPDNRAELVSTDRFTQDAIEHDPRFGKLFILSECYGEPDVIASPQEEVVEETKSKKKSTKKAKAEDAKVFKNVNDALYYIENELGVDVAEEADTDALLAKYNIVIE